MQVSISEFIEKNQLENLTPNIDTDHLFIANPDINRPALQLTGFFDHFDNNRVQIIGNVESLYLQTLTDERKRMVYDELLRNKIPCVVYATGREPDAIMLELCNYYDTPCLKSERGTTDLTAEIIRWLKVKLAPMISIHGVLIDVFGVGVLIMGDSGIGKSEAAIELIKRGHRLVSDDVVEIRKVSDVTLIGSAPDVTKHFLELRGIGIIDIRALFGVESVQETQQIDMVIQLEDFQKGKEYDRVGAKDNYKEFMGINVVCHDLPIRPGRNLAIICEAAAVNHKAKKMGYNSAEILMERVSRKALGLTIE